VRKEAECPATLQAPKSPLRLSRMYL
jgi:hypothetical protein